MNFIAFDAAYSIYPRATFKESVNLALRHTFDRDQRGVAKYVDKGWTAVQMQSLDLDTARDLFFINVPRGVGDRMTWVMPLDTSHLSRRSRLSPRSQGFQWDPVLYNSWTLSASPNTTTVTPTYHVVKSAIYRYTYLCEDRKVKRALQSYADSYRDLDWRMAKRLREKEGPNTWTW